MPKTALALRRVEFEDFGHFTKPMDYARFDIAYSDLTDADFCREWLSRLEGS